MKKRSFWILPLSFSGLALLLTSLGFFHYPLFGKIIFAIILTVFLSTAWRFWTWMRSSESDMQWIQSQTETLELQSDQIPAEIQKRKTWIQEMFARGEDPSRMDFADLLSVRESARESSFSGGTLIILGLLGTFYGLLNVVTEAGAATAAQHVDLAGVLPRIFANLQGIFGSSLSGLAASLLLTAMQGLWQSTQAETMAEIEEFCRFKLVPALRPQAQPKSEDPLIQEMRDLRSDLKSSLHQPLQLHLDHVLAQQNQWQESLSNRTEAVLSELQNQLSQNWQNQGQDLIAHHQKSLSQIEASLSQSWEQIQKQFAHNWENLENGFSQNLSERLAQSLSEQNSQSQALHSAQMQKQEELLGGHLQLQERQNQTLQDLQNHIQESLAQALKGQNQQIQEWAQHLSTQNHELNSAQLHKQAEILQGQLQLQERQNQTLAELQSQLKATLELSLAQQNQQLQDWTLQLSSQNHELNSIQMQKQAEILQGQLQLQGQQNQALQELQTQIQQSLDMAEQTQALRLSQLHESQQTQSQNLWETQKSAFGELATQCNQVLQSQAKHSAEALSQLQDSIHSLHESMDLHLPKIAELGTQSTERIENSVIEILQSQSSAQEALQKAQLEWASQVQTMAGQWDQLRAEGLDGLLETLKAAAEGSKTGLETLSSGLESFRERLEQSLVVQERLALEWKSSLEELRLHQMDLQASMEFFRSGTEYMVEKFGDKDAKAEEENVKEQRWQEALLNQANQSAEILRENAQRTREILMEAIQRIA